MGAGQSHINMTNNNPNIFNEDEVFDYVAGRLSDDFKRDFEERMAKDAELSEAVQAERNLRSLMLDVNEAESDEEILGPESVDEFLALLDQEGFDHPKRMLETASGQERSLGDERVNKDQGVAKLLNEIDAIESNANEPRQKLTESASVIHHPKFAKNWVGFAALAASLAIVFSVFFGNQDKGNYNLLSDPANLNEINFTQLVEEKRIAQVWLNKELSPNQAAEVFASHNLKPLSRAGAAWVVSTERTLDDETLQALNQVTEFSRVSAISYNE